MSLWDIIVPPPKFGRARIIGIGIPGAPIGGSGSEPTKGPVNIIAPALIFGGLAYLTYRFFKVGK